MEEHHMPTLYSIYKITNIVNQKLYIGFTSRKTSVRWSEHKTYSKKKKLKQLIHRAMRKYGPENFTFEVIYQSTNNDHCLNIMEEYFIRKFKSHVSEGGYNETWGGDVMVENKGRKHSIQSRKNMSDAHLGQAAWNKGKTMSEEFKQKVSFGHMGKTPWNKGKKGLLSDQQRKNISEGTKRGNAKKKASLSIAKDEILPQSP